MANKENKEVENKEIEKSPEKTGDKPKSTLVRDTICLFLITMIAGICLGGIYTVTKKPIAAQNEKKKQEAYESVYKGAKFETDKEVNSKLKKFNKDLLAGKIKSASLGSLSDVEISEVMKAKVDGKDAGYVVTCSGKGYGGPVVLAIGIDGEGAIKGIEVTDCSNETPGLGQNAPKDSFKNGFLKVKVGTDLNVVKDGSGKADESKIDAISGATITSSAVARAVNGCLQFIESLK